MLIISRMVPATLIYHSLSKPYLESTLQYFSDPHCFTNTENILVKKNSHVTSWQNGLFANSFYKIHALLTFWSWKVESEMEEKKVTQMFKYQQSLGSSRDSLSNGRDLLYTKGAGASVKRACSKQCFASISCYFKSILVSSRDGKCPTQDIS